MYSTQVSRIQIMQKKRKKSKHVNKYTPLDLSYILYASYYINIRWTFNPPSPAPNLSPSPLP